jgi:hypothetical protein
MIFLPTYVIITSPWVSCPNLVFLWTGLTMQKLIFLSGLWGQPYPLHSDYWNTETTLQSETCCTFQNTDLLTDWLTVLSVHSVGGWHVHTISASAPIISSYSRGQCAGAPTATTPSFCPKSRYRLILLHHSITPCTFQCPHAHSTPSHTDLWQHESCSITTDHRSTPSSFKSVGGLQERLWHVWQDRTA